MEKYQERTIDITPTWRQHVRNCWLILMGRTHPKNDSEREVHKELYNMARELDRLTWLGGSRSDNWVGRADAEAEFGPIQEWSEPMDCGGCGEMVKKEGPRVYLNGAGPAIKRSD